MFTRMNQRFPESIVCLLGCTGTDMTPRQRLTALVTWWLKSYWSRLTVQSCHGSLVLFFNEPNLFITLVLKQTVVQVWQALLVHTPPPPSQPLPVKTRVEMLPSPGENVIPPLHTDVTPPCARRWRQRSTLAFLAKSPINMLQFSFRSPHHMLGFSSQNE